jgi:hypothetical protein
MPSGSISLLGVTVGELSVDPMPVGEIS